MIAQSRTARSFSALARYLERPKPDRPDRTRVAWAEPRHLVCTADLSQMAWEMHLVARASSFVQKPVYHLSLSWAPEDQPQRWHMTAVTDEVLEALSLHTHQAVYVAHADEAYAHVHAMVNRIHPQRKTAQELGLYYKKVQTVLRHAERRYGFREVPGHYYQLPGQRPPDRSRSFTKKAHKALSRRDAMPFQQQVAQVATRDFQDADSWQDLHRRLQAHALTLQPRKSGLVITDGQLYAKSSSIAPGISRRKLEARFGEAFTARTDLPQHRKELQLTTPLMKSLGYRFELHDDLDLGR